MAKRPKENIDWRLVPDPTKDDIFHWCVELITGPYKGMIIRFDRVQFASKENEDGMLPFRFDHTKILDPIGIHKFSEEQVTNYLSYLSDVLIELVTSYKDELSSGYERQHMIEDYKQHHLDNDGDK